MKFRLQFEFHKIPEWYQEYYDYLRLKMMAKEFKEKIKGNRQIFNSVEGSF